MDLVRQYSYGATPQEVKQRKELLCFAIWCKMQHSNSVMFQLTKKDLKERLGIGYDKAKRLINQVNEDSLFANLGNGRFIVNTFKDKEIKYNRKHGTYNGALVCKMPVKKDFTLKEIYSILNNILYTFVICGAEDNSFNVDYNSVCIPMQLTTKKFMKVVNMGYGSVSRIKKQLISRGKIKSSLQNSTWQMTESKDRRNLYCKDLVGSHLLIVEDIFIILSFLALTLLKTEEYLIASCFRYMTTIRTNTDAMEKASHLLTSLVVMILTTTIVVGNFCRVLLWICLY